MSENPTNGLRDRIDSSDEMTEFVAKNEEFIARVLAHGDEEAQGYALAALANGGDVNDIEKIQRLLDELKERGDA